MKVKQGVIRDANPPIAFLFAKDLYEELVPTQTTQNFLKLFPTSQIGSKLKTMQLPMR